MNSTNGEGENALLAVLYRIEQLEEMGESAVPVLIERLREKEPLIRRIALTVLCSVLTKDASRTNLSRASSLLVKYLNDEDDYIRGKSLATLGQVLTQSGAWDSSAVEAALSCWSDEKRWVREVAAEVVQRWGEAYPSEMFQKLTEFITRNLATLEIKDPATGTAAGDYALRALSTLVLQEARKKLKPSYSLQRIEKVRELREAYGGILRRLETLRGTTDSYRGRRIGESLTAIRGYLGLDSWKTVPRTCWTCRH